MTIPTYITRPLVNNWITSSEPYLKHFLDFIIFKDFESFIGHIKRSSLNVNSENSPKKMIVSVDASNLYAEIIHSIREIHPGIKVILFDIVEDSNLILDYLSVGYNSIIEVGAKPYELIGVIQKLTKQEIAIGSDLIDKLLVEKFYNNLNNNTNDGGPNHENKKIVKSILTEKQLLVFDCLLLGHTYKEIAQSLGISFYSVNQRAKAIYKKLGVKSRIELMNLASSY